MKTILIANQKGGCGKTLVVDELAFSFDRTDVKYSLYDLDGQGGIIHEPKVIDDADYAIVDTPGYISDNLGELIQGADLIIIPTRTTYKDIPTLQTMLELIEQNGKSSDTMFIFNAWNRFNAAAAFEDWFKTVRDGRHVSIIPQSEEFAKASKAQMKRILKHHRLRKVIKLPEDVFFNVGVTTSIFIFETGTPQDKNEFFACWMESDGLATVKNKGRHDIYNKWSAIEDKWVDIVMKQSGDDSCQWVKPEEHLSYQMPQKPFEIFEEDFRKTAMDYLMFQNGVDTKKFGEKLLNTVMYSSSVSSDDVSVTVNMQKDGDNDGKN